MAGPSQEGKEPGDERSQNRDLFRIGTNDAFSDRDQEVNTASSVHRSSRGHDAQDDEKNVNWWRGWCNAKENAQKEKTNAAPNTEADAVKASTDKNAGQHNYELNPEQNRHSSNPTPFLRGKSTLLLKCDIV